MRAHRRQRSERGALLGIVLILLVVLFAASVFAYWGLRSDTSGAGNDREARQLLDCAEQGLAIGKQFFGQDTIKASWPQYFNANNVCQYFPCQPAGPFPTGGSGAPPTSYPTGTPWRGTITINNLPLEYTVGAYNNPGDPTGPLGTGGGAPDDNVIVYSVCRDLASGQSRSVQALLSVPDCTSNDYAGQLGGGFNNSGNRNRGRCR